MPSKLDPHLATIESWLAAEPQLTALAIVGRLTERDPETFGPKQHSIVQRLLKALRKTAAENFSPAPPRASPPTVRCPVLWTARAMTGPTRPQALFSSKPLHGKTTLSRFRSDNIRR